VRVLRAPCMGACDRAPVAAIGHEQIFCASAENVTAAAKASVRADAVEPQTSFQDYTAQSGYRLLRECLSGARTRDSVIAQVSDADLRGLGEGASCGA